MNKQELIEWIDKNKIGWKSAFGLGTTEIIGTKELIKQLEQLDKPQKVKVPAFVAEWFEKHKKYLEITLACLMPNIRTKVIQENRPLTEFEKWATNAKNKPFETIIRMKDGYEVEEEPKWVVNEGDLVIRKGEHEAKVYFVESIDEDGILLVNGIKDEFFTDVKDRSVEDRSINYFYKNFRLLAKKESLEVEKV